MLLQAVLAMMLLAGSTASAQPVEVASGQDLTDWQVLEQRRLTGDDAVLAYRAYIEAYGDSPLAVAAWGRLVALDAGISWADDPVLRERITSLRKQWSVLDVARKSASRDRVATIDVVGPANDASAALTH